MNQSGIGYTSTGAGHLGQRERASRLEYTPGQRTKRSRGPETSLRMTFGPQQVRVKGGQAFSAPGPQGEEATPHGRAALLVSGPAYRNPHSERHRHELGGPA